MKFDIERFISVQVPDPDDARRRRILNILLLGVVVASLFATVGVLFASRLPEQQAFQAENQALLISIIVFILGNLGLYQINRRYSGRLAAILFLLFLTAIFVLSDTPQELAGGRSLFLFALPIIMASILLSPGSSFIFATLSSFIISVLALSIEVIPNAPAIIGFFMLAFVSWLSARSLESALQDLRVINAHLDEVVVERTQALSESLERERIEAGRNQAILNSIADGVIVFDRKWNAILANPAIRSMLEIPIELILDRNFSEFIEHPNLTPQSRTLLRSMIEQDTQPIGFRIQWSEKTLSVSAAQVYDKRDKNSNIGIVTVFRDFTREAEVERLKSTFVAIVSHELRTPLSAILGYAEMFREEVYGPMNEKQVNMAHRIIKNTQRLLGLINDLLDQAQMEAGKLTIKMGPVKPAELLETLHGLMDKTASDKNLRLTSEIEDTLPEVLNGDPERLQQILVNFVNNAIKFTDQGEVRVKLLHFSDRKWGIEVSDTGHGIPEAELTSIFDTFRQVEGSATRTHGGFGLGLSIVKQLVQLMGGEIRVTSKLEQGSIFTVILPLIIP